MGENNQIPGDSFDIEIEHTSWFQNLTVKSIPIDDDSEYLISDKNVLYKRRFEEKNLTEDQPLTSVSDLKIQNVTIDDKYIYLVSDFNEYDNYIYRIPIIVNNIKNIKIDVIHLYTEHQYIQQKR